MTTETHDTPPLAPIPWSGRLDAVLILVLTVTAARLLYIAFFCPYALIEDEAHYWEWSRHLDWSYYSKGPGIAWTIALTTLLAGDTEFGVRLSAPIIGAVLALAIGQLAYAAFGSPRARFFAVVVVLLVPTFQFSAIVLTIDGPYLACWALAALAGWHALNTGSRRAWFGLGAAIAVGFLYKYTILLIVPGLIVYAIIRRTSLAPGARSIANLLLGVAVAAIGLVPVLIWNAQHEWDTVRHLLGHLGLVGGDMANTNAPAHTPEPYSPMWTLGYLGALVAMLGVPVWLVVHASIDPFLRSQQDRRVRTGATYCLAVALPIIVFYLLVSFLTEVEGNWPIAAYVTLTALAGWGAAEALTPGGSRARTHAFRAALVAGVLVGLGMTRLDLAARLSPEIELGRLTAAPELARSTAEQLERLRDETGLEPFVIAEHYGRSSLMAFYLPGQPTVFCASSYTIGRRNQYDLWPSHDLDNPALLGRPAVFLRSHPVEYPAVFERQTDLGSLPGDHKPNRHAYLGYGYLGFDR